MTKPAPKRENILLNLLFNIALPSIILAKLSRPEWLGPIYALILALAFPLSYGGWDFIRRRQANFISIIGFTSVLLTGGFTLATLDGMWFAVKEASVPAVIGLAVLFSMKTKRPLVRQLLYNDQIIDVGRVDAALVEQGNRAGFDRLLANASYLLVGSFLLSAALNFGLARLLLRSPTGTPEFNEELAKMNWLSWPVIVVPSMAIMMFALWRLFSGIKRLTGLELDQVLHAQPANK